MKAFNKHTPLRDRFEAKVARDGSGCWLWNGKVSEKGYGIIQHERRRLYAHRVGFELFVGSVPNGLELDHLCRVRRCVNPAHLEPVPHVENVARGEAGKPQRDRTHCKAGHPYDETNTYTKPDGARGCKECRRAAQRRFQARNRERLREQCRQYYHRTKSLRIS